MVRELHDSTKPSAFFICIRDQVFQKTHIRLANNVGIIDSGYRGCIGGYFDVVNTMTGTTLDKMFRVTQLCSPNLEPFRLRLFMRTAFLAKHFADLEGLDRPEQVLKMKYIIKLI